MTRPPLLLVFALGAVAFHSASCSWRPSMPKLPALPDLPALPSVSPFAPYTVTTSSYADEAIAGYRTFGWTLDPAADGDADAASFLPVVQGDIERELEAKGYRKAAPGGQPDFRLAALTVVRGSTRAVEDRYFGGKTLDDVPASVSAPKVPAGETGDNVTLVLDVRDARTGELSWRGSTRTPVDLDREPGKRVKAVPSVVAKLMAPFPAARGAASDAG